ncbi:hypothetical protein Tsubulata_049244 [Turnera subulata]|uniref:DUF4283 domain-containing protein n=1 Tax=Turnera subulata TaxID=218843 RepID=A0A9Q0GH84_9ROSI|nr:hypothetical protein Tsubulata_049244 [Turnera subulata]
MRTLVVGAALSMAGPSSRRIIDLGGGSSDTGAPSPKESLGAIVARTYVNGKVLGDRRPHISQIRSQMQNVWYIKGDFQIIPKMNNVFLIGFELEEDKKKVLKGSPWLISNMHFCLKGWFPDMILSQVSFRQVLFWVKIHDIPPNLLSHERVVKIGAAFPVFHYYEPTLEAMLGWQGFIRARVEIATGAPLQPGVSCLDQKDKEIWIRLQYERLAPDAATSSKKRKLVEVETLMSPIHESARRTHTGIMNTVAELITDLHDASPIHASASKPSWKKLARKAKVKYQPSQVDLIQEFEAMAEGRGQKRSPNVQQETLAGDVVVQSSARGE